MGSGRGSMRIIAIDGGYSHNKIEPQKENPTFVLTDVTEEYVEAYFTKQQEDMKWKLVGDTGAAIRSYQCGGMFDLLRGMGYSNKEIAEMVSGWNSEEENV